MLFLALIPLAFIGLVMLIVFGAAAVAFIFGAILLAIFIIGLFCIGAHFGAGGVVVAFVGTVAFGYWAHYQDIKKKQATLNAQIRAQTEAEEETRVIRIKEELAAEEYKEKLRQIHSGR